MMMQPAVFPGAGTPPPLRANTGGPMSRTRTQRVQTTLLGRDDNIIRCPRVIRLGLLFDSRIDPVAQLETLLLMERIEGTEDLRQRIQIPHGRLICRPFAGTECRISVVDQNRHRVLMQALMLGLCTAHIYDPARPVLWTAASLSRGLDLFEPQGFYA
jgi:hypothetical protein